MGFDLTQTGNIPNGKHVGRIVDFEETVSKNGKTPGVKVEFYLTKGEWEDKSYKTQIFLGSTILQLAQAIGLDDELKTPDGKYDKNYEPDPEDYINEEVGFTAFTREPDPNKPDERIYTNLTFFPAASYTEDDDVADGTTATVAATPAATSSRRPANARR